MAGLEAYHSPAPDIGSWRRGRLVYALSLGSAGWWVDVEHPESMAAIRNGVGAQLRDQAGVDRLTRGVLCGENRIATTLAAGWIKDQTLDDDSVPLGIRYSSKVGHGYNWAYWPRTIQGQDPMSFDNGVAILKTNPDLLAAADRFGLRAA